MSSFISFYSKGLISMITGTAGVLVGLVTGIHLLALAGVVVFVWGVYRFHSYRSQAQGR